MGFDIRINEEGFPYILEACLFCSFSPLSVIPALAAHAGREDLRHPNLFHSLLNRVTEETTTTITTPPFDPVAEAPTVDSLGDVANSSSSRQTSESDPNSAAAIESSD